MPKLSASVPDRKTIRVDAELWAALRERSSDTAGTADAVVLRILRGTVRRSPNPVLPKKFSGVVGIARETWALLEKEAGPFESPCRCLRRLLGIPKPGRWGDSVFVPVTPQVWAAIERVAVVGGSPETPRECLRMLLGLKPARDQADGRQRGFAGGRLRLTPDLWAALRERARPFESPKDCLSRLVVAPATASNGKKASPA